VVENPESVADSAASLKTKVRVDIHAVFLAAIQIQKKRKEAFLS